MQSTRWDGIPVERVGDAVQRQVLWGANGTLARLSLTKDVHVAEHSHPAEQFSCVLEGAITLRVSGTDVTLRAGDMLVIPAHAPHEAWVVEDCLVWDFFTEVREDWKAGQNQYLTGKA